MNTSRALSVSSAVADYLEESRRKEEQVIKEGKTLMRSRLSLRARIEAIERGQYEESEMEANQL